MPAPNKEPCTYFDIKQLCKVLGCNLRPAMRKTGKCAPHSVTPFDPEREDDWVDCYEGCIKHDPVAHRRYLERQRDRNRPSPSRVARKQIPVKEPLNPQPLPTLNRLMVMSRHDRKAHPKRYGTLLRALLDSRELKYAIVGRELGWNNSKLGDIVGGRQAILLGDFMQILDYLGKWDVEQRKPNE